MPSDDRVWNILKALRGSAGVYEAAIRLAADRIDALLAASVLDETERRGGLELGAFAAGRIDVERFSALTESRWVLDDEERSILAEARHLLQRYMTLEPHRLIVDVPSGGRMCNVVMHAFAELGCPFGAALAVEMLRRGRTEPTEHGSLLHGFPRHRWNRSMRAASPPLVVTVDGSDLWAVELASFLDGNQRIGLVVRGAAPPAALVRLITPGALVFQTASEATFCDLLTKCPSAPAVGALVPDGGGAAQFVHMPDAGHSIHDRLTITAKPQGPTKALAGWTTWQQEQELQQLLALASPPSAPAVSSADHGSGPESPPVDRLAAWLLSQADALASRGQG